MDEIIVVDSEYQDAAHEYDNAAFKVPDASRYFTSTVLSIVNDQALAGQAARNVASFIGEMNRALGSSFGELTSLAAKLCTEYVEAIDEADKELYGGGIPQSYIDAPNTPYPAVLPFVNSSIQLNRAVMEKHISTLKSGPVKDIEDYLTRIGAVDFGESKGATKDQSVIFKDSVLESLAALKEIFDAFIRYLENVCKTLADADASLSGLLNRPALGPQPLK